MASPHRDEPECAPFLERYAILDRLAHNAQRTDLAGKSLRRTRAPPDTSLTGRRVRADLPKVTGMAVISRLFFTTALRYDERENNHNLLSRGDEDVTLTTRSLRSANQG